MSVNKLSLVQAVLISNHIEILILSKVWGDKFKYIAVQSEGKDLILDI